MRSGKSMLIRFRGLLITPGNSDWDARFVRSRRKAHVITGYCEALQRRDDGCGAQAVWLRVVRSPLKLNALMPIAYTSEDLRRRPRSSILPGLFPALITSRCRFRQRNIPLSRVFHLCIRPLPRHYAYTLDLPQARAARIHP